MKVTFQIVHNFEKVGDIIFESIKNAYENLYIEKSNDELHLTYEVKYNLSLKNHKFITGFEVEIEEISKENHEIFLDSLTEQIKDDEHSHAVIKFHDETRFNKYLDFYKEIAELEMKLREILSYIFYYEYSEDFYNLLYEYEVKLPKDSPKEDELQKRLENQFFYLTFSNYLCFDSPKEIKHLKHINDILGNSESYDEFRDKICNRGIKNEKHLEFLAGIKSSLETIEGVRNGIAHNRTISNNKLEHYDDAREHLIKRMEEFWEESLDRELE
jgi:hypothetical protein